MSQNVKDVLQASYAPQDPLSCSVVVGNLRGEHESSLRFEKLSFGGKVD